MYIAPFLFNVESNFGKPSNELCIFVANVISEEVVMKWYKDSHSVKGKMMFLEQMKKFVEWLQSAEEGNWLGMGCPLLGKREQILVMCYCGSD